MGSDLRLQAFPLKKMLSIALNFQEGMLAHLTEEFGCEVPQMRGARHEAVLMLPRVSRNKADEVHPCPKSVYNIEGGDIIWQGNSAIL